MSKDCHESILQESPQQLKQQQRKQDEEDEEKEKGIGKDDDEEEEVTVTSRKLDDDEDEGEECKTPSSRDHKIPAIQSCPPTPRKKPMMRMKRKVSELQFFETTRSEEVESFFGSNSYPFSTNNTAAHPHFKKRRCKSA
ncbi:hypothetical protein Golob_019579 [Gossypium lobatum]|uniref:Cyclin-dependent protein kinase inhibitor SMR2 n=1 Tax=Gossypium lobatum TaxID=34289 RepID=A0A7J8L7P8_9ROSI|nr:hypothetical protein [Gossypium lobatum]